MLSGDARLAAPSTITSPVFRESALGLSTGLSPFNRPLSDNRGRWEEVDRLLEERFSNRGEFPFTVEEGVRLLPNVP